MFRPIAYVGRFAPSPTGPLHAGSLVAAVASWLDARAAGGRWLLRIEDIDTPRCDPAHARRILTSLDALGLHWDGPVVYQSSRLARYREIFQRLQADRQVFHCACSRKQLRREQPGPGEVIYPGTCRKGLPPGKIGRTWRFKIDDRDECFSDRLRGRCCQNPAGQCGDFVVLRADGLFAYQLVVVIDDADDGVTDIVRGADLLSSTGRQVQLQRRLHFAQPRYLHIPVLNDARGYKLSKQNGAREVPWQQQPELCLNQALAALGQPEQAGPPEHILNAAAQDWDIGKIPQETTAAT